MVKIYCLPSASGCLAAGASSYYPIEQSRGACVIGREPVLTLNGLPRFEDNMFLTSA